MSDPTEHTVRSDEGTIAAVDYGGAGPDVVLIHGGNRTLLDWTPMRALLPGMRHIAYDLRGHGGSSVPPSADYSFASHQRDLEAVIAHLGLDRPFLVGHSVGGNVAVRAAGTGITVAGVVSLDGYGAGVYEGPDGAQRRESLDREIYSHLEPDSLQEDQVPALVARSRAMMAALGADPDLAEPTPLRALVPGAPGTVERRPPMSHQRELAAGLEDVDFFTLLAAAACPVLVIKADRPIPTAHLLPDNQQYVAALAAGAESALAVAESSQDHVHVVRVDSGHMLHLQRTIEVASLVADFIARN